VEGESCTYTFPTLCTPPQRLQSSAWRPRTSSSASCPPPCSASPSPARTAYSRSQRAHPSPPSLTLPPQQPGLGECMCDSWVSEILSAQSMASVWTPARGGPGTPSGGALDAGGGGGVGAAGTAGSAGTVGTWGSASFLAADAEAGAGGAPMATDGAGEAVAAGQVGPVVVGDAAEEVLDPSHANVDARGIACRDACRDVWYIVACVVYVRSGGARGVGAGRAARANGHAAWGACAGSRGCKDCCCCRSCSWACCCWGCWPGPRSPRASSCGACLPSAFLAASASACASSSSSSSCRPGSSSSSPSVRATSRDLGGFVALGDLWCVVGCLLWGG
jgi:hypothetical protein